MPRSTDPRRAAGDLIDVIDGTSLDGGSWAGEELDVLALVPGADPWQAQP